jgi:DDE superfamily endonuclease
LDKSRLLVAIAISLAQFTITYKPPLRSVFATESIPFKEGILVVGVGFVLFIILHIEKHAKTVKAWLLERKDKIEVFYLPSYSPELNPEERLNADLKQAIGKKVPVRTKSKLHAATEQHMDNLAENPERILRFFQDKWVKYAA